MNKSDYELAKINTKIRTERKKQTFKKFANSTDKFKLKKQKKLEEYEE